MQILGCRDQKQGLYFDGELSRWKKSLYRRAAAVATLDLVIIVGGVCAATAAMGCLGIGAGTGGTIAAGGAGTAAGGAAATAGVIALTKPLFNQVRDFITRATAVTAVGTVAASGLGRVANWLSPWSRWEKADAFTVVWELNRTPDDNPNVPLEDRRKDLEEFKNLIDEGLCEIDQRRRREYRPSPNTPRRSNHDRSAVTNYGRTPIERR